MSNSYEADGAGECDPRFDVTVHVKPDSVIDPAVEAAINSHEQDGATVSYEY